MIEVIVITVAVAIMLNVTSFLLRIILNSREKNADRDLIEAIRNSLHGSNRHDEAIQAATRSLLAKLSKEMDPGRLAAELMPPRGPAAVRWYERHGFEQPKHKNDELSKMKNDDLADEPDFLSFDELLASKPKRKNDDSPVVWE